MKPIDNTKIHQRILRMLTVDPDIRPNARDMLQDEYFHQEDVQERIQKLEPFIEEERVHRTESQILPSLDEDDTHSLAPEIRQAMVKWLLEIQQADHEETHPQTVFLSIELFDKVMNKWQEDQLTDLKYIAIACLNIASKYLEMGLDLDFVYCWNHSKFHENQGVPKHKIPQPTDEEIEQYIETLHNFEQQCLMLLDFRVGGNVTALDRTQGDYKKAYKDALQSESAASIV